MGNNLGTLGEEDEEIDEDLESSPNSPQKTADNLSLPPNPVTPKPATVIFTATFYHMRRSRIYVPSFFLEIKFFKKYIPRKGFDHNLRFSLHFTEFLSGKFESMRCP